MLKGKACLDGRCSNSWHHRSTVSPAGAAERSHEGHNTHSSSWMCSYKSQIKPYSAHVLCQPVFLNLSPPLRGNIYPVTYNTGWNSLVFNDLYTIGIGLYSCLIRILALFVCLSAVLCRRVCRDTVRGLVENDALRLELGKAWSWPDL